MLRDQREAAAFFAMALWRQHAGPKPTDRQQRVEGHRACVRAHGHVDTVLHPNALLMAPQADPERLARRQVLADAGPVHAENAALDFDAPLLPVPELREEVCVPEEIKPIGLPGAQQEVSHPLRIVHDLHHLYLVDIPAHERLERLVGQQLVWLFDELDTAKGRRQLVIPIVVSSELRRAGQFQASAALPQGVFEHSSRTPL
mmetsp:Transcript_60286/g.168379  ORF Transcript_60286/g.168379 Transcript_60286/m.168379 type:complete len:202 (-) Transcript_60286:38-643(-)